MRDVHHMDAAHLPNLTPLAKDYLCNFESTPIRDFFAISPTAPHEQMRTLIDARLTREHHLPPEHRAAVVAEIESLAVSIGADSKRARENIELLKSPHTLAVVTGQQLGILGGPLYSFYKAFTAIHLARTLSRQYEGFAFVPIFWLEGEDHDFDEIASAHVLNAETQVETIRYRPTTIAPGEEKNWKKLVGPIVLEESSIETMILELRNALPPTDFTDEVLALAQGCYTPGRTLQDSFARLMAAYFAEDGLLLFDAGTGKMKELGRGLFRQEVETSPQLSERIILQSVQLEEIYHAQVKPRAINLFYINDEGERLPIVERERGGLETARTFFLKGSRKTFTLKELLHSLDHEPERFSPNVLLRPIYQDTLLPTVSYVAGPGEISYYAQFKPAYEWAGLPMPLIYPRMSLTLVEERFERSFTKFQISAEDILMNGRGKNASLFDQMIDSNLSPAFAQALTAVDGALESLRKNVTGAEATLDGALTSLKGKVLTAIRDFENKTLAAERKRHTTTKTQLDKLLAALLPEGELQERELNLLYFLNKYGMSFVTLLKQALVADGLDTHEHRIVHIRDLTVGQTSLDGSPRELHPLLKG
ncbi:MAG: bacillithiol biosynthesis cysteine-adding enzyme BshC [Bacteroidota bacterium]|nr:bacillithiol biosynthesis cysteine-adding enzyme BshC [Bacteroidota bacterium]MDP4231966.1 bacillithiol biosynthesis cysteine-adding enzyme BshC [Bacteroidota bacterium]MDP4241327.1 bacillithiol biosynthesis cysteine-adding enzyme BshC [Bacteroidota bacterium]MDP4287248.1 bacillithiol biosynthesis cysteine-adding enzyme BshC [Bacteroidota bacterium]